jgi:hypothetical protein
MCTIMELQNVHDIYNSSVNKKGLCIVDVFVERTGSEEL